MTQFWLGLDLTETNILTKFHENYIVPSEVYIMDFVRFDPVT